MCFRISRFLCSLYVLSLWTLYVYFAHDVNCGYSTKLLHSQFLPIPIYLGESNNVFLTPINKNEYKVYNGTDWDGGEINSCQINLHLILLGYFQFNPTQHTSTSNQFLFHPVIHSWDLFELNNFFYKEIQHDPQLQIHNCIQMQQYTYKHQVYSVA